MLRKRDLLWLLLFPLYLLIGTLRHELAHAAAAHLQGAEILKFTFWPSRNLDGTFYFGYVLWHGETNWVVNAAPYFFDTFTYALFFPLVFLVRFRNHWLWINLVIIGLISPIVNSLYNYMLGSDVRKLLSALPDKAIHGYFLLGISLGLLGLAAVFKLSQQSKKS